MNILVISQFYPPDLGAVAFRMEAIVKKMRLEGHNVYVIAATPNRYSEYKASISDVNEDYEIRLTLNNTSKSVLSRVKGFFEFYIKCVKLKKQYTDKNIDVVISTTPYILEGLAGQKIAKHLNTKHLLDVRDLWPDTPIALGRIKKFGPIAMMLRVIERKLYKNANHIICTSPGYIDHIKKITPKKNIDLILNGIDTDFELEFKKFKNDNNIKVSDKVVVLYAGNIGVAQNLTTLIKAAIQLRDQNFHFKLVGAGTQLKDVKQLIDDNHLTNVDIVPPVKRHELFSYYLESDILYLQLYSNKYFSEVVPSKIFEYLLIQKPIIYGLDGVSRKILNEFEDTFYVEPDNVDSLVN